MFLCVTHRSLLTANGAKTLAFAEYGKGLRELQNLTFARSPSHKTLRIDVDRELDIALGFGCGGEPFAQIGRQVEAARRFDQQAEPVAAAHQRERRFGGAEHAHALLARCYAREL